MSPKKARIYSILLDSVQLTPFLFEYQFRTFNCAGSSSISHHPNPIQLPRVIEWGVGVNNLSPPSPPPAQYYLPAMVLGGTSGKLQLSSIETLPVHQNFSCQKSQLERSKLDKNEQINQQIVKAEQGNSRKKLKPVKSKSVQITFSSGGQKCLCYK